MEGTEKNINVQIHKKSLLVIFTDNQCESILLSERNARYILIELINDFSYEYDIINYYVNKHKFQDINLN